MSEEGATNGHYKLKFKVVFIWIMCIVTSYNVFMVPEYSQ